MRLAIRPMALALILATGVAIMAPYRLLAQAIDEDAERYASLRAIALRRDTARITLVDGSVLEGMIGRIEADAFVLRVTKGEERVIRREQLAQVRPATKDRQRLVLLGVAVGTFLLARSFWNWLAGG